MSDPSWNSQNKFNQQASGWDDNPRRTLLAETIAKAIIADVTPQPTMRALEFGCGTGLVTLAIAPLVSSLTAVDTSEEMLGVLRGKIAANNISTVQLICTDLSNPPADVFSEEPFDLIYSSMTLHHISEPGDFLRQIIRYLAPGGTIAIADLDKEDGYFHDDPDEKVHHGFERSQLSVMLQEAGLDAPVFSTPMVMEKTNRMGMTKPYSIFLVTAHKRLP
ncbi:MAG: class I SAM-dependent methyltransferase [Chlorobiaceae bacterium]|jgi:ubiquinone/menaquinone biosynthesis C-methylase UbiE|nr:class I SAM-dependent methyltransferase [Chlorobiaceae bacterium]